MKKNIPTLNILNKSNGEKGLTQPPNCHCHCGVGVVTNAQYEEGNLVLEFDGGQEHKHYGLGSWWKNGDCSICEKMKK